MDDETPESTPVNPLVAQAQANRAQQSQHKSKVSELEILVGSQDATQKAIIEGFKHLITYLDGQTVQTNVKNHPKKMAMANIADITSRLENLNSSTKANAVQPLLDSLTALGAKLGELPTQFPEAPEPLEAVTVKNMVDPRAEIKDVIKAIKDIKIPEPLAPKFDPKIEVKPADVTVTPVDLKPVQDILKKLLVAFVNLKIPENKVDLKPVQQALIKVNSTLQALPANMPMANFILPFKNAAGAATQVQLDSSGNVPVNATVTVPPVTTTPTFKDDPTNAGETPKYGKTNSTTHKQMVEADITASQTDQTATGTITTTTPNNVTLTLTKSSGTAKILITGTWTGTLTFQGSVDGVTFTTINSDTLPGTGLLGTTTSANGTFVVDSSAFTSIQVLGPTSTGTANVTIQASIAASAVRNLQQVPLRAVSTGIGDGAPNTQSFLSTSANTFLIEIMYPFVFNGSTWDRMRGDTTGINTHPAASATTTGLSVNFQSALTNTAVAIKASAGRLYGYNFFNPGTALVYVQIFNVAAASVTLGTTTPIMSIGLPSSSSASVGVDVNFTLPITFGTAMSYACTATPTGSGAPGATIVTNCYFL
jgi:hypothetical protein